jgi:hypothetical protein
MKILLFITGCLLLSSCASNKIYYPIKVSCWDIHTGKIEENIAVAGITVGSGWFRAQHILLGYTDTQWHQVTVDLTNKRCAIAAYRE